MTVTLRHVSRASFAGLAILSLGVGVPLVTASAETSPARTCVDAGNVWVSVEFDDAVKGGCATVFGTGMEALTSAGFTVVATDGGFINTLNGEPSTRGPEDWWSYAHSDAGLTKWEFYEVGAMESKPRAGSIEGWRLLHSYATTDNLPSSTPATLLAPTGPTTSPSASATPTPKTSATPSATTRPTPLLPKTGV